MFGCLWGIQGFLNEFRFYLFFSFCLGKIPLYICVRERERERDWSLFVKFPTKKQKNENKFSWTSNFSEREPLAQFSPKYIYIYIYMEQSFSPN